MLSLGNPWLLLLLPLPVLVYRYFPSWRESSQALWVPFFDRAAQASDEQPELGARLIERRWFQKFGLLLAWLCLLLAIAEPKWLGEPQIEHKSARDLMVLVDLSGSMETQDFVNPLGKQISRTDAVKEVLHEFIKQREHDRLGLIVFGDAAFLQAPFTEDHQTWLTLLDELQTGMAGQQTRLGDALGLAIKLFSSDGETSSGQKTVALDSRQRVVIVLTDGNDTGSKVPPVEAAKIAATEGISIYTIAIGNPDSTGDEALDVRSLKQMSELTAGQFFQALNMSELEAITAKINSLEPETFAVESWRPMQRLHHWLMLPVFCYFAFLQLLMALRHSRYNKKLNTDSEAVIDG